MKSFKIKIYINDRNYNDWSFVDNETNQEMSVEENPYLKDINPSTQKIFSRDVLEVLINNENPPIINIDYSYIKTCEYVAGVLMLEGNKTFGRTQNKKRLLYKCVPDDHRLPTFLIPYEMKSGFSKSYKNKFVIFRFDNWNNKHPEGILIETLGDVDNLEAFYEFQLYCKNLHVSLVEFTNKTRASLNKKTNDEFVEQILNNPNFMIEDRRERYIFTIDPVQSLDYDDGFGIEPIGDNWCVSIYIANVFVWLETLGLWNSFSKRVSTIYLPDRRRPMLPTILSDTLCSLQQNQPRFALVMDIIIDQEGRVIGEHPVTYKNVLINVKKNYSYEDSKMINNDTKYKQLFDVSFLMNKNIKNSFDLVAHWMVQMNTFTGMVLANKKTGIFRSVIYSNNGNNINNNDNNINNHENVLDIFNGLNDDTVRVIKSWNNIIGQYIVYNEDIDFHHMLIRNKLSHFSNQTNNNYIHITSPIRRLVDLLNQIILFDNLYLVKMVSNDAKLFLENWINQIEYINTSMRYIRKIQTSCQLLTYCFHHPEIMEREYDGVVFDKVIKNDGFITYMVYLEELKLLSRITTQEELDNYSKHKFHLYLFEDEDKMKKKIRLKTV
jgi:exoribonuclease R